MSNSPAGDGRPFSELIEAEITRRKSKREVKKAIFDTLRAILLIAAASVLLSTLLLSVLRVNRSSMSPTLKDGEIVIALKRVPVNRGDIIAFYYNNKLLVKRVTAKAGDWVDIDEDGTVSVNGVALDEPYVTEKAFGECNIRLPYQVPDGSFFVMGDHRVASLDSRSTEIGTVHKDMVEGKVFLRIWPLPKIKLFM